MAFRQLSASAFLVCAGIHFLLCASAYPQAKGEGSENPHQARRTFPLTQFYNTPNPLPPGRAGDLIRSEEFEEYDVPAGVNAVRILYHSKSAAGQDVAASGVVLYPDAKPPAGGWPVIAWAHALTGVARQCAPSLARSIEHGPFLSMYVNLGYAVVATDYAGLGTSFRNAFSDTQSNASDVIYSVLSARAAVRQLGSRWVAVGLGQGGPAALGVAELERDLRDPNYLGSIAISGLEDRQDGDEHSDAYTSVDNPLFLAYGIKTVYPQFDVKTMLTEKAMELYARVEQACGDPRGVSKLSAQEMLKPNWGRNPTVKQYFSRNTLGQRPAEGPLLVISNGLDPIPIQRTELVIRRMCQQGDRVQFDPYPQSDPGQVFGDSVRDQISWLQARFAGRPATSNCGEQR